MVSPVPLALSVGDVLWLFRVVAGLDEGDNDTIGMQKLDGARRLFRDAPAPGNGGGSDMTPDGCSCCAGGC